MLLGRLEFLEFISQSLKTVCFHKETRKKERNKNQGEQYISRLAEKRVIWYQTMP